MCNGPSDTEANIKACLSKTTDMQFLEALLKDYEPYSKVGHGPKMVRCIKAVMREKRNDT